MPSPGGIRRDQPAVANGLTLVYSSGTAEGTICRVKALKRQMSSNSQDLWIKIF
jgi:transposase